MQFDCYDHDQKALDFARDLLAGEKKVRFIKGNALKMARSKNILKDLPVSYDIIYSMGLFDYLPEKIAVRLIGNLRTLLNEEGYLCISNVGKKYCNPSVHFMEWAGDWNLIYRREEDFRCLFLKAGFELKNISLRKGKYGIMQYVVAGNKVAGKGTK